MSFNDRISALGPPRGGRVVRDAQEVIREMEEQSRHQSLEAQVLGAEKVKGGTDGLSDKPAPLDLMKFEVGQMIYTLDYFELRDLAIPEGKWKSLKLLKSPAYGETRKGNWNFWDMESNSNLANPLMNVDGVRPESVWCSLRVLYWFMRAGYELREIQPEETQLFRNFLIDSMNPDTWHFSDLFTPTRDGVIQKTGGLTLSHPLFYSIHFPKSRQEPNGAIVPGVSAQTYCNQILGDRIEYVSDVLRWYSDRTATCVDSIRVSNGYKHSYCSQLSLLGNTTDLGFGTDPQTPRPAHFVVANPLDFTPIGGKQ